MRWRAKPGSGRCASLSGAELKRGDLYRVAGRGAEESEPAALFGFASVWRAYLACRRRKRGTAQAQRYEMAVLDQVENTAWALQQRCFSPSRSICFIARQPKAREIHLIQLLIQK